MSWPSAEEVNLSESPPPYLVESVDKALRILLMFRKHRTLRVTDVSVELGVARSTAHRLLSTLMHQGFVSQDRLTKAYRSGRVFVEIGLAAIGDLDVRRKARHYLEQLSLEYHETVNLLMLEGAFCRFIDGVEGDRPLRVGLRTGLVLPAHTTSGGKVLLAELPVEEVRSLYKDGMRALTKRSLPNLGLLEVELERVRRRGHAVNHGESEEELSAVAVPVRNSSGQAIAALALSTPTSRMSDRDVLVFAESLKRVASRISGELTV